MTFLVTITFVLAMGGRESLCIGFAHFNQFAVVLNILEFRRFPSQIIQRKSSGFTFATVFYSSTSCIYRQSAMLCGNGTDISYTIQYVFLRKSYSVIRKSYPFGRCIVCRDSQFVCSLNIRSIEKVSCN